LLFAPGSKTAICKLCFIIAAPKEKLKVKSYKVKVGSVYLLLALPVTYKENIRYSISANRKLVHKKLYLLIIKPSLIEVLPKCSAQGGWG
jgi:hypothetical protein